MPKLFGSYERGKLDLLTLFGVGFLMLSLITAVSITNNPLKTFLISSFAKGSCDDIGSAPARNKCKDDLVETEDEAIENQAYRDANPRLYPATDSQGRHLSNKQQVQILTSFASTANPTAEQAADVASICASTGGSCSTNARDFAIGTLDNYYYDTNEIDSINQRYNSEIAERQRAQQAQAPTQDQISSLLKYIGLDSATNFAAASSICTQLGGGSNCSSAKGVKDFATSILNSPKNQEAVRNQITQNLSAGGDLSPEQVKDPPFYSAPKDTTTTTSSRLDKTDEGFIRTTTTIIRDATGKIVDSKSISTTAKTTSTFTQKGADLIRTDTTVTTDLATGKVVDTAKSQTTLKNSVAQPTTSITVNQQGTVSIKQPAGSVCTFSSDCESGGCGIGGERGGITKTCQTSPDPQPQTVQASVPQYSSNAECMAAEGNNIYKCRGTTSTQETLNTLNTLTFGAFGNYVSAFQQPRPSQAETTAAIQKCVDEGGNAYGCMKQATALTKEQVTSSIKLGTTLTAEGAALVAVPATFTAGSLGGGFITGLTAFGGISTLTQTSTAAVAQIEDPGSAYANQQTGLAVLSWANLIGGDYLLRAVTSLSRGLNTFITGANIAVDVPTAAVTCKDTPGLLSCGGAIAAVVADFGFGALDIYQGQTIFRNVPNIDIPSTSGAANALTPPKIDVPDPLGARIISPEELKVLQPSAGDPVAILSRPDDIQTNLVTQFSGVPNPQENTLAQILPVDPSGQIPETPLLANVPANTLDDNLDAITRNIEQETNAGIANAPEQSLPEVPRNVEPDTNTANNIAEPQTNTLPAIPVQPTNAVVAFFDNTVVKPIQNLIFGNPVPKTLDSPLSTLSDLEIDGVISNSPKFVDENIALEVGDYFNKNYYAGNPEFRRFTAGLHADVYQFNYKGVDYVIKIPSGPDDVARTYMNSTMDGQRLIVRQGLADNLAPTTFISSLDGRPMGIQKYVEGNTFNSTGTPEGASTVDLFKQHGLGISDPKLNIVHTKDGPIIIDQEGAFLIDDMVKAIAKIPEEEIPLALKLWTDGYTSPIQPSGLTRTWDQTKIIINTIPETGAGTNFIKTIARLDDFWNKPQVEGNPSTARSVLFAEAQQQIKEEVSAFNLVGWYDDKVVKPIGDLIFGKTVPETLDTTKFQNEILTNTAINEKDLQFANSEIIGPSKLPNQTGDVLIGQVRADQANILSKTGLPHPSLVTKNPDLYVERLQAVAKENGIEITALSANPTTEEIKNAAAEVVIKLSDRYDALIPTDVLEYRVGLAIEDLNSLPANTIPQAKANQDILIQKSSNTTPTDAELEATRNINASLEEEIRLALYTDLMDPATDLRLLNKSGGDLRLYEILKGTPPDTPVTIVDLGLSGLKKVNDTFGHDVGDKLLVESARIINSTVANSGIPEARVIHITGKEYRLILPGADEAAAKRILDQITANIETARLQNLTNPDVRIYQNMGFDYGIVHWDRVEEVSEFAKRASDTRIASESVRKAKELEMALANPPRAPSLIERFVSWIKGTNTTAAISNEKEILGPSKIPSGRNLPEKITADQASLLKDTGLPNPELITKDPRAYVEGLNKVIDDNGLTKITVPPNPTRTDLEIAGAHVERMIIEKFESFTPLRMVEYKSTLAVTDLKNYPLNTVPHLDQAVNDAVFRSASEELQLLQQRTTSLQTALNDARYKDPMTGLYNKAGGDKALTEIIDAAKTINGKVALIAIDVSGLGNVNKRFGPAAGDQLLLIAADIFDTTPRRSSDIVFRVGDGPDAVKVVHSHGDEFTIILPGTDEVGARKIYERLYEELRTRKAADPTNSILQIANFDAGISHWNGRETIEQLVNRADEAMYANKVARKATENPTFIKAVGNFLKTTNGKLTVTAVIGGAGEALILIPIVTNSIERVPEIINSVVDWWQNLTDPTFITSQECKELGEAKDSDSNYYSKSNTCELLPKDQSSQTPTVVSPTQTATLSPPEKTEIVSSDTVVSSSDLFGGNAKHTEYTVPGTDNVNYHVVTFDLDGVKLLVDAPSRRTTTSDFLARGDLDIAINGDGWFRYTDKYGVNRFKTVGYSIANGVASNSYGTIEDPEKNRLEEGILFLDENNSLQIVYKLNEIPSYVQNAISFPNELIKNGEIVPHPDKTDINPRTAIGETADHRLIVVVVEGTEYQTGMKVDELSGLMKELGAVTAVMFDSGTSSTLAIAGQDVIASCGGGGECQTANHLGFDLP